MKYYYSPSTGGFYVDDVHGKNMPGDAASIDESEWRALLDAQTRGMQIVAGTHGLPIARPYRHTDEELAAELRRQRDELLAASDGAVARHRDEVEMGGNTTLTPEQYMGLLNWRTALRNVTKVHGFPRVLLPEKPT